MKELLDRLEAQTLEIARLKAEVRALEALRVEADERLAEAGDKCTLPHFHDREMVHYISAKLDYADLGLALDRESVTRTTRHLLRSLADQISIEDVTSRPFSDPTKGGWWWTIGLLKPQPEFRIRELGRLGR